MQDPHKPPVARPPEELTGVVERNIQASLERRRVEERRMGWEDRLADGFTRFTGSMRFVYLHLVVFPLWIVVNLPWSPLPRFNPSYVVFHLRSVGHGSIGGGHLSVNLYPDHPKPHGSLGRHARGSGPPDQSSGGARDHAPDHAGDGDGSAQGIDLAENPELAELAEDIAPEKVLDTMEAHRQQFTAEESQSKEP
jgi:hypothetical protein